jgi:4-hydroxy-4-methyl-2-oxoglutarate aldolase
MSQLNAQARAETGDWIFGDADGVVVVPQAVAGAIFAEALRKVESEDRTRQELLEGRSLAEVYNKYGVL